VKLLKLPTIYVVALGAILNLAGFRAEGPSFEFLNWIKGTYSTLGMMLIGIALSQVQNFRVDWLFTSFAFALKFLVWPAATALVFYIDKSSALAANTVAFASLLKAEPEKCAIAVLLSTLLGMILMSLALQYPAIF
jgi:predicted permease